MPIVFISGSGRGIGKALAIGFALKKWDVIVHYNNSQDAAHQTIQEIANYSVKSASVTADLRKPKQISKAFMSAVEQVGVPDVLINNAGVFPQKIKISDMEIEDWDSVMDINLKAQFLLVRQYLKYSQEGRIINISSLGGIKTWENRLAYNTSKAGVIQLSKNLARELAPQFSVNCICPGKIENKDDSNISPLLSAAENIPMKRFGLADDIFEAAYFFATCTKYITGQAITVDGGLSLMS